MLGDLFGPAAFGNVCEAVHQFGPDGGGLGEGLDPWVAAYEILDDLKARRRNFGTDVDEADARQAVAGSGGEAHCNETAARGAEDRRAVDPEMVEERERVERLGRYGVGVGAGPFGLAAAAIIHPDQADAREMRRKVVEVGGVPGQAREGENGLAGAFVGIVEAGAIGRAEVGHQRVFARSGMVVRSDRT